jgi:hypothetical protein
MSRGTLCCLKGGTDEEMLLPWIKGTRDSERLRLDLKNKTECLGCKSMLDCIDQEWRYKYRLSWI